MSPLNRPAFYQALKFLTSTSTPGRRKTSLMRMGLSQMFQALTLSMQLRPHSALGGMRFTGYSIWELKEFLSNFDSTNLRVWIAEVFDCDDFAQVLQGAVNGFFPGIAFGTIWYGPKDGSWGHAVNIFYSYTDNQIYLVEPQNDAFYLFDKNKWNAWVVML
jgi:hypothetical protein